LLPQSVVHECAVQDAKGVKLAMAGAHPVAAWANAKLDWGANFI